MVDYTSRPPASARAARRAWDYFTAKHLKPGGQRRIEFINYSPNCYGARAWIGRISSLPDDTKCWGGSYFDNYHIEAQPCVGNYHVDIVGGNG